MDSLAPGGQKTCDAAVVVDPAPRAPGARRAPARSAGSRGARAGARRSSVPRPAPGRTGRGTAAQPPRWTAPRPRRDGSGRRSWPVLAPRSAERVRDLAERDIGVDARTDAREDVLRASRRRLEGRQRRAGGAASRRARTSRVRATWRASSSGSMAWGAGRCSSPSAVNVEADDQPLAGLDRPLGVIGGIGDRILLVALVEGGKGRHRVVDGADLREGAARDLIGEGLDVVGTRQRGQPSR